MKVQKKVRKDEVFSFFLSTKLLTKKTNLFSCLSSRLIPLSILFQFSSWSFRFFLYYKCNVKCNAAAAEKRKLETTIRIRQQRQTDRYPSWDTSHLRRRKYEICSKPFLQQKVYKYKTSKAAYHNNMHQRIRLVGSWFECVAFLRNPHSENENLDL